MTTTGNQDILLALETSGRCSSFALLDNDNLVSEIIVQMPSQHKDSLALWIDQWLREVAIDVSQLSGVAVSCGPGSFTGLRVGMSLAKGLCLACNIPLWSVPTLEAMVYAVPPTTNVLCPTTVARRGECYAALYRWSPSGIVVVEPPFVASASALSNRLSGPVWLWGEGVQKIRDDLEVLLTSEQEILTSDAFQPRASAVARLARQKILAGGTPAGPDLEPFYLKQFPG
jgi:tRNA threonylcarbamoyladenosine biosynthesis protein TsaB